ncbi:methionine aminopeptidase 1B, chloroplastic-like isoform X1 [Primulina huaijiensis]|uniref:methionine aminopeptidase 1B, chloroplastic-like isoform X1 n=1 Tax=Primulina huaijiensis TaxID=1492673 RepID=UPI003CC71C64
MAFANASVSAAPQLGSSSLLHDEPKLSASFSVLMGAPLTSCHPLPLSCMRSDLKRHFVIYSKKVSGLEEAIRIKREHDLRKPTVSKRRPPLRRGKVSQRLLVPDHIPQPPYLSSKVLPEISSKHQIHDSEGIYHLRAACQLAARVLEHAGSLVRPSVTTNEIDKAVHQMIIDAGAYPSPLGYGGFPKSVCTSVNECMCHGIPDSRQLQDGDIINIDVTVYLNGYHGDTSKTFICGDVNNSVKRLVKVTEECMYKGIAACEDGALFRKIGKRISDHAEKFGYGVVDRFVGHGIGTIFHSEPFIFHHRNDKAGRMVEGQTFTIEPILTLRPTECMTWEDNWTTLTANGCPAAQFEHTILITRTGAEILTKC